MFYVIQDTVLLALGPEICTQRNQIRYDIEYWRNDAGFRLLKNIVLGEMMMWVQCDDE